MFLIYLFSEDHRRVEGPFLSLLDEHRAQVSPLFEGDRISLGLLVKFGHYPKLEYERIVI